MPSFAVLLFVGGPARSDKHQYGRLCQKGVVAVSCVLAAQLPHRTSGRAAHYLTNTDVCLLTTA